MFKNYIKIALRHFLKYKVYSFINVSGLAIGMACCILIFLFVQHEWSYDTFHKQGDSIYRLVIQETKPDGSLDHRILIPPAVPPALIKEFPAVKDIVQLVSGRITINYEGESFRERLFEADPSFFSIFTFPLLAGDPKTVLTDISSMVINEKTAEKYFGSRPDGTYNHALNKTLSIQTRDGFREFTISGVMKNFPINSSLQINMMISFENYQNFRLGSNDWGGRSSTYLVLDKNQEPAAFEEALRPFTATQFENRIQRRRSRGYISEGEDAFLLKVQPLSDLHLNPNIRTDYEQPTHNPIYSYFLSGIAILILAIACINFMTLSVGRSTSRAREVGMRKVVGAQQGQLMKQFWGEALLLSFLALWLGIAMTIFILPVFNNMTGQNLSAIDLINGSAFFALVVLIFVVGIISGSYPAIVLSRFQPVTVLKGDIKTKGSSFLTRSLVVVQYTMSIALMIGTGIMLQQLEYLKTKDLGYTNDQIIVLRMGRSGSMAVVEKYRNEVISYDRVLYVAGAGQAFAQGTDRRSWDDENNIPRSSYVFGIDYDYIDLMSMEIVAGRDFSRDYLTDPTFGILVNESLVKEFKLENPVGKKLNGFARGFYTEESPTILGVVKDYHFRSLHEKLQPSIFMMHPNYWTSYVLIKIRPDNIPGTLKLLEGKWNEVLPNLPFRYSFLDQDVERQYRNEVRASQIIGYSALLALFIACLGLFGLASLVVSKRTKEIGIRKVLGSSVSNIVVLLSKEFAIIVFIATVLAWPFAYYGMREWLQNFAYRIDISYPIFIVVGLLALIIALLAVSYQSVKAALANPVDALRYE